ncbi:MAG: DUF4159 domain-containing protein [Verrucomicrobiota bacterium]
MSSRQSSPLQKLFDKFSDSRDFTISFVLHVILVTLFGTTVLFQAVQEPPDFQCEPSSRFVAATEKAARPPTQEQQLPEQPSIAAPQTGPMRVIETIAPLQPNFRVPQQDIAPISPFPPSGIQVAHITPASRDHLSRQEADDIDAFTKDHNPDGKVPAKGTGIRDREFVFTAYIGQYSGGNWNSTIQQENNKIENGSLPNLLDFMHACSKNKVKTNYQNVQAIRLDSDQLFVGEKETGGPPPFVFMTGTRDFKLSDKEVENLQKYVRLGGAIWGDSSVPGSNSRFDIAFRREMRRVIPDVDKDWEVVPLNHPIFAGAYFPEVKDVPAGLNFYKEPVYALKIHGEIAVLYTANDYGDMWQVGLNDKGQVDLRRNERNSFVAINTVVWGNRETYLRNLTPQALTQTYKFGTNIVIHLLTRWENRTASAL